jgi:hypothetical protein
MEAADERRFVILNVWLSGNASSVRAAVEAVGL